MGVFALTGPKVAVPAASAISLEEPQELDTRGTTCDCAFTFGRFVAQPERHVHRNFGVEGVIPLCIGGGGLLDRAPIVARREIGRLEVRLGFSLAHRREAVGRRALGHRDLDRLRAQAVEVGVVEAGVQP